MSSFLAFPVPPGGWLAKLPPTPKGTRLMAGADLHLTVAFLGALDEPRARHAFSVLAAEPIARVFGTLGEVVPLGPPRRPSAVAALCDARTETGQPLEEAILAQREHALAAAGLPQESRDPLPHITLARPGRSVADRRSALDWASRIDLEQAPIRLERFALYRSVRRRNALERGGPRFEILDSVELPTASRRDESRPE